MLLRHIENLFKDETRKAKITEISDKHILFFEINKMDGARLQEFFEIIAVATENPIEYSNISSAAALFIKSAQWNVASDGWIRESWGRYQKLSLSEESVILELGLDKIVKEEEVKEEENICV